MKKIIFIAVAAIAGLTACTGGKTARTSDPDSLFAQACSCSEKCACDKCQCPDDACAQGKCVNCPCVCEDAQAACQQKDDSEIVYTLAEAMKTDNSDLLKKAVDTIEQTLKEYIGKGDTEAINNYVAIVSKFLTDNYQTLQEAGMATVISNALSNIEGMPTEAADIIQSAAKGEKSAALTNILNAMDKKASEAAAAAQEAVASGREAINEAAAAVDAAPAAAKEAAKEAASKAIDAAAAAAKEKLGE